MSEAEQQVESIESYLRPAAAAAPVKSETPVQELDTSDGIPNDDVEAEDEGVLAEPESDKDESDIDDDDTPEDDESDEGNFERRFKDTQAALTETKQELSSIKKEYAESVGEITTAKYELQDKFQEAEQTGQFWANVANQDLQQLRQVNVQQLTQEQYAQWQQQVNTVGQRASMLNQALARTQAAAKTAREEAQSREALVARRELELSIDNFSDVYPEMIQYAESVGVSSKVAREMIDPGFWKIVHEQMAASKQPDVIDKISSKTPAKRPPPQLGKGAQRQPKTLAERMYGDKK